MDWGSTISDIFGRGIDAYADIESAKNYQANGAVPMTVDAYGNAVPVGQSATFAQQLTSNPMMLIAGVALILLIVMVAKK